MTGDSCLARAVVPRTAAAVDHADTELIGHDGHIGDTGLLCNVIGNMSDNKREGGANIIVKFIKEKAPAPIDYQVLPFVKRNTPSE